MGHWQKVQINVWPLPVIWSSIARTRISRQTISGQRFPFKIFSSRNYISEIFQKVSIRQIFKLMPTWWRSHSKHTNLFCTKSEESNKSEKLEKVPNWNMFERPDGDFVELNWGFWIRFKSDLSVHRFQRLKTNHCPHQRTSSSLPIQITAKMTVYFDLKPDYRQEHWRSLIKNTQRPLWYRSFFFMPVSGSLRQANVLPVLTNPWVTFSATFLSMFRYVSRPDSEKGSKVNQTSKWVSSNLAGWFGSDPV